jgi:hypothetical protein
MVVLALALHPAASVMTTLYEPAARPEAVAVVAPFDQR